MEILILVLVALAMLAIGVPIGIALCCGLLALSFSYGTIDVSFISQAMYTGQESLPILAVPCFMLAGDLMLRGGLTERLVNIAKTFTGHTAGGLGNVTVLASMFFGAISGSAPATTSAIGGNMIPAMEKESHYDKAYATGLASVAGSLGIIIPPSIPFVVYASATSASVGDLFIAGVVPGIIVGVVMMVVHTFQAKKHGYVDKKPRVNWAGRLRALKDGFWAVMMPVIILGGIYSGVFTPTEASVVSVAYGIIVGIFIYRNLTWKDVWELTLRTATKIGGFMLAYAPAACLGSTLILLGVTSKLSNLLLGISHNIYIILFIVVIILMIGGMFLDTTSNIVVFGPILYAVLSPLGVNVIHLGVIMIVCLAVGFVTPPVCMNVFVASNMTGLPVERIVKPVIPQIVALFLVCVMLAFVPGLSLIFV